MGLAQGLSLCISHRLPDGGNLPGHGRVRVGRIETGPSQEVQGQVQLRWDQEQVKGPTMAPMDCVVGGTEAACVWGGVRGVGRGCGV